MPPEADWKVPRGLQRHLEQEAGTFGAVDYTVDDAVRVTGQRPPRARMKRLLALAEQILRGEVLLEDLLPEVDAFSAALEAGLGRLRREAELRPDEAVFSHAIEAYERMLEALVLLRRVFESAEEAHLRGGMAALEGAVADLEDLLEQAREREAARSKS